MTRARRLGTGTGGLPAAASLGTGLGTLLLVLLALALPAGGRAAAGDGVAVPVFVDPGRVIERPALPPGTTIRFLTGDDFPPFNFRAPDGSLAGFNVDLARAICGELKVACSIQALGFDALLPALEDRAGDAVIASLSRSARLRERVDFSLPTMRTPARFVVREGSAMREVDPDGLARAVVGVQGGTAHEAYLRAFFPAAILRLYPDPGSLRTALQRGEVDALFADGLATALWLNGSASDGCCRFAGGPYTESRFFGEGAGIAVRKGDATLRRALDYALARLTRKGTIADLYLEYFPIGFY